MPDTEQRAAPIRAAGVDWADLWRQKVEARMAADAPGGRPTGPNGWDDRAARFERLTRELDPDADPLARAIRAAVQPTDAVLDVGAGAGRYTFAVAPLVARVTAVEPSPGMRTALEREAAARAADNVTLVPATWQEADVEPHDVALVANVLYFVADPVPFLEKVDRSARRACYIFHRVEDRASVMGRIWTEMGAHRPPEPGFLDLYNLLFAMGIRPHARLLGTAQQARYDSLEEAFVEARWFLGLGPDDQERDDRIRALLADILLKSEGRLGFPTGPQMAMVFWEKGRSDGR